MVIESSFARGNEKWTAEDAERRLIPLSYNALTQTVSVSQPDGGPVYFMSPPRFLGDQRASYNQDLEFKLRIGETSPVPAKDLIIEGASLTISQPIFGQNNPLPTVQVRNCYLEFSITQCNRRKSLLFLQLRKLCYCLRGSEGISLKNQPRYYIYIPI